MFRTAFAAHESRRTSLSDNKEGRPGGSRSSGTAPDLKLRNETWQRKEGREEGREGGREGGRQGGRQAGREGGREGGSGWLRSE